MTILSILLIGISLLFLPNFLKNKNSEEYSTKMLILELLSYFSFNLIIILNIITLTSFVNSPCFEILSITIYVIFKLILFFNVKKRVIDNAIFTSINKKISIAIFLYTFNTLILLGAFAFIENIKNNNLYLLALDLYFMLFTTIIIFIYERLYLNQRLETQKMCNKTVLTLYDDTRAFKHDFHNIIQAIGGYIETNDIENLHKYYKDVLNDCKKINNLSKLDPNVINHPVIYSILTDKYYVATDNNIAMNFEVLLDLKQINMHSYDLSRVFGILLDNAIEASKECSTKNINILFKKDDAKQMIIIENTYNNKQISIDKIFEKNYTTKPHNTGLGLWQVRKILKKYSNLNLYTSKTDDYFSQQLEIYNTG